MRKLICMLIGHARLTLSQKGVVDVDICPRCDHDFMRANK